MALGVLKRSKVGGPLEDLPEPIVPTEAPEVREIGRQLDRVRGQLGVARESVADLENLIAGQRGAAEEIEASALAAGGNVDDAGREARRLLAEMEGRLGNARGAVPRLERAIAILEQRHGAALDGAISAFRQASRARHREVVSRLVGVSRAALTLTEEECRIREAVVEHAPGPVPHFTGLSAAGIPGWICLLPPRELRDRLEVLERAFDDYSK